MDRRAFLMITAAGVLRVTGPDAGLAHGAEQPQPVTVTPKMLGAGAVSSGVALPPIPPVTGSRSAPVPWWGKSLPYPILIADRRNNRLLEVTPDKRIVWEFSSPSLKIYRGNEDVNFSPDGRRLAMSEEDNSDVHIVDYEARGLVWTYGTPDIRGSVPGPLSVGRASDGRRAGHRRGLLTAWPRRHLRSGHPAGHVGVRGQARRDDARSSLARPRAAGHR